MPRDFGKSVSPNLRLERPHPKSLTRLMIATVVKHHHNNTTTPLQVRRHHLIVQASGHIPHHKFEQSLIIRASDLVPDSSQWATRTSQPASGGPSRSAALFSSAGDLTLASSLPLLRSSTTRGYDRLPAHAMSQTESKSDNIYRYLSMAQHHHRKPPSLATPPLSLRSLLRQSC